MSRRVSACTRTPACPATRVPFPAQRSCTKRCPGVRTQVVHHQRDPLRLRIVLFHQPAHPFRPCRRCVIRCHIGPAPIIKRCIVYQQMPDPVAPYSASSATWRTFVSVAESLARTLARHIRYPRCGRMVTHVRALVARSPSRTRAARLAGPGYTTSPVATASSLFFLTTLRTVSPRYQPRTRAPFQRTAYAASTASARPARRQAPAPSPWPMHRCPDHARRRLRRSSTYPQKPS